jgi:hypothetical protein
MSKVKCFAAAAVLSAVVLVLPGFASAQTVADLQAQIQALLAQIQALQTQLGQAQGGGTPQQWCHTFNTNLGIGSSGDEVDALDAILAKEVGFSGFEHGSNFQASFDERVASAVSAFQEKYRSEILTPAGLTSPTGYVGASTRRTLNQLYGCGSRGGGGGGGGGGGSSTSTTASTLYIADVSGVKQTYAPSEQISLTIKGIKLPGGMAASSGEGFNVQVYINSGTGQRYGFANGSYNPSTGYWNATLNAPADSSLQYDLDVILYCSNHDSLCGTRYGVATEYGQVDKVFRFNVSGSNQYTSYLGPSLDPLTPASANYNPGGTDVAFTIVRFSSTNGDSVLSGVNITSDSPNAATALSNIRVYDASSGRTPLGTSGLVYDPSGNANTSIQFNNPIAIPNATYKTFIISADITSRAAGSYRLGVDGYGGNYLSHTPGTVMPVWGNYMTVNGVAQLSITVLSPNGGEQFSDNQIIPISVKIRSNKTGSVKIWLIDESNSNIFNVGTANITPSNINYLYTVNLNLPELKRMGNSVPAPSNMYRTVTEWNSDDGTERFQDGSDNRFSIVSAATTWSSTLTTSLDPSTPVAATVAPGQTNVAFAKIKFTSSGGDSILSSVAVGSDSANSVSNLSNIKVYSDQGVLLGNSSSLSPTQGYTGTTPITIGSNVSILNGSSKTIIITADVNSSASGNVRLGAVGFGGNYYIGAGLPVFGNSMTVTAVAPSITITSSPQADSNGNVTIRQGDQIIISGTPLNVNLAAYGTDFTRAFFFDSIFTCTNNSATERTWTMQCVASNTGTSRFYVEIYKTGQTYRSNTITVTVAPPTWVLKYDYDGDGKLTNNDLVNFSSIVTNIRSCPAGQVCDLDGNGRVTITDAVKLQKIFYDYDGNGTIDQSDLTILLRMSTGVVTSSCPVNSAAGGGYVCDLNGDGKVGIVDLSLYIQVNGLTNTATSTPSMIPSEQEQMASILNSLQSILNQMSGYLLR